MYYEREKVNSFEVEPERSFDGYDLSALVADTLGLGEGYRIGKLTEEGQPRKRSYLVYAPDIIKEVGVVVAVTATNPDFEVEEIGGNRFWIGFDHKYDQESVEIVKEEIATSLRSSQ